MKKICIIQIEKEIEEIRMEKKIARKPRAFGVGKLNEHKGRVLAWAHGEKVSKQMLSRLIYKNLGIHVTTDQAYHFVKRNNDGVWPNSRKKEK